MKKGNNAWNKPLEIWEIMALSSASPKSYPILTSPRYEEEKRRFEPVDKVEEQNDKESNKDFSQPSYQETALSPTERATSTEEFHQRMGKTKDRKQLSEFQGEISPALSQQPPQSRVCIRGNPTKVRLRGAGESVSMERAFRDMSNRYCGNTSTNTRKMWKDGGNSELLHSSNASLRRVTVFNECSNTAGAYNPIFYISKVCLCTTNCHLYHKDPCPERGLNHSKVVIRKQ